MMVRCATILIGIVCSLAGGTALQASVGPCEAIAFKVRKAARLEARADFWLAIAADLNSCEGGPSDGFWEAFDQLQEELEEAQDQFEARLDLCDVLGSDEYCPDLDVPFSATVMNGFMPLIPGRTLVYQGLNDEGELEEIRVTALDETIEIAGITCREVRDTVTIDDEVIEDTFDWFAEAPDGSVWYLGEISLNYEDGFLESLEGSWRTDHEGALPGIVMPGTPVAGDVFRAEYLVNEAEDIVEVIALDQTVTIGLGTYTGCLQMQDTTPLSPGEIEWKYYAPGIGMILEVKPDTGETVELVEIIEPTP